jgi:hypothetical protein
MSPSEYPGELCRVAKDRVGRQHEACEVRWNIRARRGARIVVRVQEPVGGHEAGPSVLIDAFAD